MLLCQSLDRAGLTNQSVPIGSVSEMLIAVEEFDPVIVCISALPPFAIEHTRTVYQKLRSKFPELNIIICLWHFAGDLEKARRRLKMSNEHSLFVTLPEVLQHIGDKLQPNPDTASTIPADDGVLLDDRHDVADVV
jgi:hypothetical protein